MNKKLLYSIVFIWLLVISVFVIFNEIPLLTGKEVLLKIYPVDPRDLFRGDYVNLNYEINSPEGIAKLNEEQIVYTILNTDKNQHAYAERIEIQKPENKLFIKGKYKNGVIKYGIENYFVKEGEGRKIEEKLMNGGFAKVMIDKRGNSKVKVLVY